MESKKLNVVVIGDARTGKTCSLIAYISGKFPDTYIPTVYGGSDPEMEIDDFKFSLQLIDTRGHDDPDENSLRPLSYIWAHVFVICFSVDFPGSFKNIKERWLPDLTKTNAKAPIIIVAMKTDLRDDKEVQEKLEKLGEEPVSKERGEQMSKEINAVAYHECSALRVEGLNEWMQSAASVALEYSKTIKKKRTCILL